MAEPVYIASRLLAEHGFSGLFTLRGGGVSPAPFDSLNFGFGLGDPDTNIETNLDRLSHAAGLASFPHQVRQVHGSSLHWCSGKGLVHQNEADILLSNEPGTALAVRTADCLPILLAEPQSGICAAVHAGWRGTAARVVLVAVKEMQTRGAVPERILASLGPCIGPCCFNIGKDVAERLAQSTTGAEARIRQQESLLTADLQGINRLQLEQIGLKHSHMEQIHACTACDRKRFFSYRRDGERSGRHLAVVAQPCRP